MRELRVGKLAPAAIISGALVIAGVALWMLVSKSLLFVAAFGAFGPGVLRELGWLRDHDEYQRQAAHRAGYHAYLVGGLAVTLIASYVALNGGSAEDAGEWLALILVLMWGTWMFSALLAYWGPQKTTSRILLAFGSFWALFVIAVLVGDARMPRSAQDIWLAVQGLLAGTMFVAPFFLLAWSVRRWPQRTGMILLLVAAGFAVVTAPIGGLRASTILTRDAMLVLPLVACGIALLRSGADVETDG